MRRLSVLLAACCAATGARAQSVSYALPEPGRYECGKTQLSASTTPAVLGRPGDVKLVYGAQVINQLSLTLLQGGRYQVGSGAQGLSGSYSARADGSITFASGPLAKHLSSFQAKKGIFEVFFFHGTPGNYQLDFECYRLAKAAQQTIRGDINPGLPGTLLIMLKEGGQPAALQLASGRTTPLAFLPKDRRASRNQNGEFIFMDSHGEIVITDAAGKVRARVVADDDGADLDRRDFVLSPDGQRCAYTFGTSSVVVRSRAGKLLVRYGNVQSPSFLPDGRLLLEGYGLRGDAFTTGKAGTEGLYLADGRTPGLTRFRLPANIRQPRFPSASPDGRRIVFTDAATDSIYLMNSDGSALKAVPLLAGDTKHVPWLAMPAWSPDGKWFALLVDWNGAPYNGELLVLPVSGDLQKIQLINDADNDRIETSDLNGQRLSWW